MGAAAAPEASTCKRATTDVSYSVQTTTDLTAPASWTATGVTQGTPNVNGLTTPTLPYA